MLGMDAREYTPMTQFLISTLKLLLLSWIGLALFALLFARSMLFHPPEASYQATTVNMITNKSGVRIALRVYGDPNSARYTVIFSHGNAENIATVDSFCQWLAHTQHLAVVSYDYQGYGLSEGRPSEAGTYEDIRAVYHWLIQKKGVPAKRLVAYGYSIGSGVTIDLAHQEPLAGIILQSPFLSAYRVITHWTLLPWDQYNNLKKIKSMKIPALIMHGDADQVVPFWHGQALWKAYPGPKQHLWVHGADHLNLVSKAGQAYDQAMSAFLKQLPAIESVPQREHPVATTNTTK